MSLPCKFLLLFVYTASTKTVLGRTEPEGSAGDNFRWPWQAQYTRIRIINNIENNSSFTIHCKSRDDDLGIHVMQAGEIYDWKFSVNFVGTTLFYCNTYWNGKFIGFDAFNAEIDQERCRTECAWRVVEAGILGYFQQTQVEDRFYMWR